MTVNYDEQANHYEETRNVIPLVYSTLIAIIKPKANEKILDFGCGTGNYLLKLTTDYNIIPYGVEPSSVMRKIAAQKNPSATIVEGNHEAMPINIQFDSIYCTDVIHHIDNLRILFLNLFKISKPGTLLCICTESYSQLKEKYWNSIFLKYSISTISVSIPSMTLFLKGLLTSGIISKQFLLKKNAMLKYPKVSCPVLWKKLYRFFVC